MEINTVADTLLKKVSPITMNIKYLTRLNNSPAFQSAGSDYIKTLQPISMDEMTSLENTYNNGRPFPVVLQELLFLAGNYCYVLDYGLNESQEEMQEEARADLVSYGRSFSISRPFYVIDVYNSGTQFLFVYLDEGVDDPTVYEAFLADNSGSWITSMQASLSGVINARITKLFSGYNPF